MSSVTLTYLSKVKSKIFAEHSSVSVNVGGIPGPQGPKGDKGDKGDPGTGTDITAENGVRLDVDVIKLGGALTEDTVIPGAGKSLDIGTFDDFLNILSFYANNFFLDSDVIEITNSFNQHIQFDSAGFRILNANSSFFGSVRISDGTEGAAKILTSDINGNATWQDPASGSNQIDLGESTDADFAMVPNGNIHMPRGGLTSDRTITIPVGVFPNTMEFYNNEEAHIWFLTGEIIYDAFEEPVTQLFANTNYMIKFKSGKWRIRN